jgi:hypothetical protein
MVIIELQERAESNRNVSNAVQVSFGNLLPVI